METTTKQKMIKELGRPNNKYARVKRFFHEEKNS